MMTWAQIRDLTVSYMAEYDAGAPESAANASIAPDTLYFRIGRQYKRMLDKVARHSPHRVTSLVALSYPAQSESVALPDAVKYRDIFSVERLVSSTEYEPVQPVTEWQEQQSRLESQWLVAADTPTQSTYGYRIEATSMYVYPKPAQDLDLRIRYFAAVADLTSADSANTPTVIPDEFGDLIALATARSIKGETSSNPELEKEYRERWADFEVWATQRPKRTSLRFVIERD